MFRSVILEIRPRLRSVNVFVALTIPKPKITDICLNPEGFEIHAEGLEPCKVPVKNLKIFEDSLSCVNETETSLSFRFATDVDTGTFNMELLKISESSVKTLNNPTFLDQSSVYVLYCKNCDQKVTGKVSFSRVLPLPSNNLEPSDWFCHGRSDLNLDPKAGDIFYSCSFFHVNKGCIENTLSKTKILVCNRCLSWLGLVKNSVTFKFWFNTVGFYDGVSHHNTKPLSDTFACIRNVLNSVLFSSTKVILDCASSESQTDYVLIWVLEKELNISVITDTTEDSKVAKVLFKYQKELSAIVTEWENDVNATSVTISKPMMVEILKHLHENKQLFPKTYSESNDFYISYLKLY